MVDLIGVDDLAAGAGMLTLPDTVGLMIGASSGGTDCMHQGHIYLPSILFLSWAYPLTAVSVIFDKNLR